MRLNERYVMPAVLAWVLATVIAGSVAGCAKAPADLEPGALPIWQANEVQVHFGTLQRTAIALNGIPKTDGSPVLSDNDTRTVVRVVRGVVTSLQAVPSGWKATANAALKEVASALSPEGQVKLGAYVSAITALLEGL